MREFLKKYFNIENEVNEDVVWGTIYGICTVVAGFVPQYGMEVVGLFSGMTLVFFGKKMFNKDI